MRQQVFIWFWRFFHTEQKLQDKKNPASQQQYNHVLVSSAIDIGRLLGVNYYRQLLSL